MDFTKNDLGNLENVIRLIKRQKFNDLGWEELQAAGAALIWLDRFHTNASAEISGKNNVATLGGATSTIDVKPSNSKKTKKGSK